MVSMVITARRLATTGGNCETREGAEQQRKSAIQQKRQLAEIIIETKLFK